jgi:hypothetical protein
VAQQLKKIDSSKVAALVTDNPSAMQAARRILVAMKEFLHIIPYR